MKMLTGIYLGSAPLKTPMVRRRKGCPVDKTPAILKAILHRFHLGVELVLPAGILGFVASHWKNRIRTEEA